MPIYETLLTAVDRVPDLRSRPTFSMPWTHDAVRESFFRICDGGDIYAVDIATGKLRRY